MMTDPHENSTRRSGPARRSARSSHSGASLIRCGSTGSPKRAVPARSAACKTKPTSREELNAYLRPVRERYRRLPRRSRRRSSGSSDGRHARERAKSADVKRAMKLDLGRSINPLPMQRCISGKTSASEYCNKLCDRGFNDEMRRMLLPKGFDRGLIRGLAHSARLRDMREAAVRRAGAGA